MSKQERARQPATPGPCPRCGEWIDHECYWQHVGDAPGREGAWKLRHRKADGKVCRIRGGPATTAVYSGEVASSGQPSASNSIASISEVSPAMTR